MSSQHTYIRRSQALRVVCLAVVLLLSVSAWAWDEYPATSYFLDGISADSSWNEIQAKPGIKAVFPTVTFGPALVPLSEVCIDGDTVAITNSRDKGVRVPADQLRAQAQAATAAQNLASTTGPQLAAAGPVQPATNVALTDPVKVYRVIDKGFWQEWVYLFEKPWPVPTCPVK